MYNKNKLQQTVLDIQKEKGPQLSQRYKASKGGQRRPTVPNGARQQQQAEEEAAVLLQATRATECDSINLLPQERWLSTKLNARAIAAKGHRLTGK